MLDISSRLRNNCHMVPVSLCFLDTMERKETYTDGCNVKYVKGSLGTLLQILWEQMLERHLASGEKLLSALTPELCLEG